MEVSVNELKKFNNADLIELLLQYDITDKDINGSGKNSNVLKKDRIDAFVNYMSKIEAKNKNVNLHINNDNMIDILSLLNDIDLYNTCLTNKSMYNLCMKNKNLLDRCNYIHNFISNPIEQKKLFNKAFRIYDLIFFPQQNKDYDDEKIIYRNIDFELKLDNKNSLGKIVIKGPVELTSQKLINLLIHEFQPNTELANKYLDIYGKHTYVVGIIKGKNGYYIKYD